MKICAVVKYPPIQGGVSARSYWIARSLAAAGHQVYVVTNADDVEDTYRIWMPEDDRERLECSFPHGGLVRVTSTWSAGSASGPQIPASDLFVTKLAAAAADTVRVNGCELVYSYYLEPYAVAGHLAASWTGVPHVVEHAGSDRSHLLSSPDLGTAYREVLCAADGVITVPGSIENLGVDPTRTHAVVSGFLPAEWTDSNDTGPVNTLVERIGPGHPHVTNTGPMPENRATFLVYGKVGEHKGSYELIQALGQLRDRGQDFNLVLVGGGSERPRFLARAEDAGLSQRTWTLPFIPHWRIPPLLRTVTAVCCLERDFPIEIHQPGLTREVLAAGACLVTSRELASKSQFRVKLEPGRNVLVVERPQNTDELGEVLAAVARDPQWARTIGKAGRQIPDLVHEPELAASYADVFRRVLDRRSSRAFESGATVLPAARLRAAMPATVAALGPAFGPTVRRLRAGTLYEQAEELCRLLQQEGRDPFGIADFERNLLWTRSPLHSAEAPLPFPMRDAAAMRLSRPRSLENSFPVASAWLRIERYRPDIVGIVRARRPPPEIPSAEAAAAPFLFIRRGDLLGRVLRVAEGVLPLLAACNGRTCAAEIIDSYAAGGPDATQAARRLLRSLVAEGAVRL